MAYFPDRRCCSEACLDEYCDFIARILGRRWPAGEPSPQSEGRRAEAGPPDRSSASGSGDPADDDGKVWIPATTAVCHWCGRMLADSNCLDTSTGRVRCWPVPSPFAVNQIGRVACSAECGQACVELGEVPPELAQLKPRTGLKAGHQLAFRVAQMYRERCEKELVDVPLTGRLAALQSAFDEAGSREWRRRPETRAMKRQLMDEVIAGWVEEHSRPEGASPNPAPCASPQSGPAMFTIGEADSDADTEAVSSGSLEAMMNGYVDSGAIRPSGLESASGSVEPERMAAGSPRLRVPSGEARAAEAIRQELDRIDSMSLEAFMESYAERGSVELSCQKPGGSRLEPREKAAQPRLPRAVTEGEEALEGLNPEAGGGRGGGSGNGTHPKGTDAFRSGQA